MIKSSWEQYFLIGDNKIKKIIKRKKAKKNPKNVKKKMKKKSAHLFINRKKFNINKLK